MQINPNPGLRPTILTGQLPGTQVWQPGEIIKALALNDVAKGTARFRHNTLVFEAQLDRPMAKGETAQFRVLKGGEKPVLQYLQPQTEPVSTAINRAMMQQKPLAPVLARIVAYTASVPEQDASLPAEVVRTMKGLASALPGLDQLTRPDTLRQALSQSGTLLESHLRVLAEQRSGIQGKAPVPPSTAIVEGDLKAGLLKLLASIRPVQQQLPIGVGGVPHATFGNASTEYAPQPPVGRTVLRAGREPVAELLPGQKPVMPDLMKDVTAALGRINILQLFSGHADAAVQTWWTELPFVNASHVEVLPLVIEQDSSHVTGGDGKHRWTVNLGFDLDGIGALYARIAMVETQVSVQFWAEREESVDKVNSFLSTLRSDIESDGLSISILHCDHGQPSQTLTSALPDQTLELRA
ncbi:MAG: flagellar hook-length control protein FliK [Gammaproteobacteria bacterium]|nr:flagellar hook-length control protein FliK [Gammaproteobacteria bacterium]